MEFPLELFNRYFLWQLYRSQLCSIYAGFEVVLFVTGMLVDISVEIKQVIVSVAITQLEVSGAHMQVANSEANIWVTIFVVIM